MTDVAQTYPLTVTNRKKVEVTFDTREDLVSAIESGLDTVTAGKVVSRLPSDRDVPMWLLLWKKYADKARLRPALGRTVNELLRVASRAGDMEQAQTLYTLLGVPGSFDLYWANTQTALAQQPPLVEAHAASAPHEPGEVDAPPTPEPTPAEEFKRVVGEGVVVVVDRTDIHVDPRPRPKPEGGKPRNRPARRTTDKGPTEPLGMVRVVTRKFDDLVADYYGDGQFLRTCSNCKVEKKYVDFGRRVMLRRGVMAALVQPQCKSCRKAAAQTARRLKAQKADHK